MCIVELRDGNLLTRIYCGVTIFNKLLELIRYVKLISFQQSLFKREITLRLYIHLNRINRKITIPKGIK
jgi:hypothetical protein